MDHTLAEIFLAPAAPALSPAAQDALGAAGIALAHEALARLKDEHAELLASYGRAEFGEGTLSLLVRTAAGSLDPAAPEASLSILQERFFELRDLVPAGIPDEELAEALAEALQDLEGDAAALADMDLSGLLELLPASRGDFDGER